MKKEEEIRLKEEAKERAQSRIGNFFKKLSDSNTPVVEKSDYEKFFYLSMLKMELESVISGN